MTSCVLFTVTFLERSLFSITPQERYNYYTHFTDEETEALSSVICPERHGFCACWNVWLCDPIDYSPPGSSIHRILQVRILQWVAMPSSRGSSQHRDQTQVSLIVDRFSTIWATRKAQEYWSGLPFPSLGDLPNTGIKPSLPHCRQMLYRLSHQGSLPKVHIYALIHCIGIFLSDFLHFV